MDVKSKEGNEYRNNLTIYVAKGNNGLENCVNGHLVSNHNYTLVINGNLSIRQMIDVCDDDDGDDGDGDGDDDLK